MVSERHLCTCYCIDCFCEPPHSISGFDTMESEEGLCFITIQHQSPKISYFRLSASFCMLYTGSVHAPCSPWWFPYVQSSGVRWHFYKYLHVTTPCVLASISWSPLVNMCVIAGRTPVYGAMWGIPVSLSLTTLFQILQRTLGFLRIHYGDFSHLQHHVVSAISPTAFEESATERWHHLLPYGYDLTGL